MSMYGWKSVVVVALGALTLTGVGTTTASAAPVRSLASCSGQGCDNLDPVNTGCAASAGAVANSGSRPYNGYLEMRFGNCQTNWARFTVSQNGHYAIWVERQSASGIPAKEGRHYEFDGTTTGGPYWSDQLYAPNSPLTKARVCVTRLNVFWWDPAACSNFL